MQARSKEKYVKAFARQRKADTYKAGADDAEVPPVPIPNTVVKLCCAEDTWLETTRENRQVPAFLCFGAADAVPKPWPVGQAVKTAASHAANGSSILPRVTIFMALAWEHRICDMWRLKQ